MHNIISEVQAQVIRDKAYSHLDYIRSQLSEINQLISKYRTIGEQGGAHFFTPAPDLIGKLYRAVGLDSGLRLTLRNLEWAREVLENERERLEQLTVDLDYKVKDLAELVVYYAQRSDNLNRITNTVCLPRYVRPRFVFRGETSDGEPVPAADTYVLYWQYQTTDETKIARVNDYLYNDTHLMHNIGIGRTDSQGFLYSGKPFNDLFTWDMYYNETTGNLTITGQPDVIVDEGENDDPVPAQRQLYHVLSQFSAAYNQKVKKQTEARIAEGGIHWTNQDWFIEYFNADVLYGFMLLPLDMGACELKDLARLPEMTVARNGEQVPVAVKTRIAKNGEPIDLFCPLRAWNHRLDILVQRLSQLQSLLTQANKRHIDSCVQLMQMRSVLDVMDRFPMEPDLRAPFYDLLQDLSKNASRKNLFPAPARAPSAPGPPDPYEQERLKIIEELKTHQHKPGPDHHDRMLLMDAIDDLVREIKNQMANPATYKVSYYEKRMAVQGKLLERINETAAQLQALLASPALKAEFKAYLDQQQTRPVPKNYTDITFPCPLPYMTQDYHSDYIYVTLNNAYTLLTNSDLGPTVWEQDIEPGLYALAGRKEFADFNKELADAIDTIADSMLVEKDDAEKEAKRVKLLELSQQIKDFQPTGEEDQSLLSILWSRFVSCEDVIRLTVAASPGPPCLLQAALDAYGLHALNAIAKNPGKRAHYLRVMSALIKMTRPLNNSVTNATIQRELAAILASKTALNPVKRQLSWLFLGNEVYGLGNLPPGRIQLLSSVCLKSCLSVAGMISLWHELDQAAAILGGGGWDEKTGGQILNDCFRVLGAMSSAGYTTITTTRLFYNFSRVITRDMSALVKAGAGELAALETLGGRLSIVITLAATANSFYDLSRLYDQGKAGEMYLKTLEGLGNGATLVGLLMATESGTAVTASLLSWIGLEGSVAALGTVLFIAGIILVLASMGGAYVYEHYLKEKTLITFDRIWDDLRGRSVFLCYTKEKLGAAEPLRKAVEALGDKRRAADFSNLTWHAVIPLVNLGYPVEQVKTLVNNCWYLETWDPNMDYCQKVIDFYDLVKEKVTHGEGDNLFGKQTFRRIFEGLAMGCFVPEQDAAFYVETFAPYAFFTDPFFTVRANVQGIGPIYTNCKLHGYDLIKGLYS